MCRRHGISRGCFYRFKAKYGGMEVNEARRLRTLEEETRQLKHIVAEQAVDIRRVEGDVGKKMVSPQMRKQAVELMRAEAPVSERRACGLMELHRAMCRYQQRRK